MIKTIRIFLLILILIGLALLATQKIWVPKLVSKILSYDKIPAVILPQPQPVITLKDGQQCYTYSHDATKEEPYTVNEFINITINTIIIYTN